MKQTITAASILLFLFSCSETKTEKNTGIKPDTNSSTKISKTEIKPITINILDTICPAQLFICIKDSAATMDGVGKKLGTIYGVKLTEVLTKNKMTMIGAPAAWYKSNKAPYFFEAGIPVAKMPTKMPSNVFLKEIKNDSALVARCFGSYSQLIDAYNAVKEQAKLSGKKISGYPFDVYVGDPMEKDGSLKDPSKVQTDIVFPRH